MTSNIVPEDRHLVNSEMVPTFFYHLVFVLNLDRFPTIMYFGNLIKEVVALDIGRDLVVIDCVVEQYLRSWLILRLLLLGESMVGEWLGDDILRRALGLLLGRTSPSPFRPGIGTTRGRDGALSASWGHGGG